MTAGNSPATPGLKGTALTARAKVDALERSSTLMGRLDSLRVSLV
jgi:hypothetical protein